MLTKIGVIEPNAVFIQGMTTEEVAFLALNWEALRAVREAGVFDIKGGAAVLHFDAQGRLRKIETTKTHVIA